MEEFRSARLFGFKIRWGSEPRNKFLPECHRSRGGGEEELEICSGIFGGIKICLIGRLNSSGSALKD